MSRPAPAQTRPAFTLVELLMVIGIITILIVLGISVASKVTGTGKKSSTEQAIRVLDTALNAYTTHTGAIPPAWVVDPRPGNTNDAIIIPVIDGRNFDDTTGLNIINSVGLFILQCKDAPDANAALKDLDPKVLRDYDPDQLDTGAATWTLQPQLPTAFDGWGNPIRYVHPVFKGLVIQSNNPAAQVDLGLATSMFPPPAGKQYRIRQVRRNGQVTVNPPVQPGDFPDSDAGVNTTGRPYFYSAGPDGKVGQELDSSGAVLNDFNADNVYLTVPRFQKPQ